MGADSVFSDDKMCVHLPFWKNRELSTPNNSPAKRENRWREQSCIFLLTTESKDSSRGQEQNNSGTRSSVGELCPHGLCLDYALTSTRGWGPLLPRPPKPSQEQTSGEADNQRDTSRVRAHQHQIRLIEEGRQGPWNLILIQGRRSKLSSLTPYQHKLTFSQVWGQIS